MPINQHFYLTGAAVSQILVANGFPGKGEPGARPGAQIRARAGRAAVGVGPVGAAQHPLIAVIRFKHRFKGAVRHGSSAPHVDEVKVNIIIGGVGVALIEGNDFDGMGSRHETVKHNARRGIVPAVGVHRPLTDPINKNLGNTGIRAGHKTQVNPRPVKGQTHRISTGPSDSDKTAAAPGSTPVTPGRAGLSIWGAVVSDFRRTFFVAHNAAGSGFGIKRCRSRGGEGVNRGPAAESANLHHVSAAAQTIKGDGADYG